VVDSRQVQEWLDKLRRGSLTEADLEAALSGANGAGRCQRLLYLQAESTAVDSAVSGMSIVEDGEVRIPSGDFDEWQYHTVLEAVNDGSASDQIPRALPALRTSGRSMAGL
jgi:hypothetical protein